MKRLYFVWAVLVATAAKSWSCSGTTPMDYNAYSLFNPDVCGHKDYALFYRGYASPTEIGYAFTQFLSADNAEYWKRATGYPGSIEEVVKGVEETDEQDVAAMEAFVRGTVAPASNPFIRHLIQTDRRSAAAYLLLAKRCEPHVNRVFNWFDPESSQEPDKAAMRALKDEALAAMSEHPEFKHRFLFQAVRLAHYAGDYAEALQLLEKHSVAENDPLHARLLRHKAGALIKLGRIVEGYAIVAQMFARPGWNVAAFMDFRPTRETFNELVASDKITPETRAWMHVLWGLKNGYEFTLEDLKSAFALAPKSRSAEILLTAMTRRMESALLLHRLNQSFGLHADAQPESAVRKESWWVRLWKAIVRFFKSVFGLSEDEKPSSSSSGAANPDYEQILADLELFRQFLAKWPDDNFVRVAEQYLAFLAGDFSAAEKTVTGDEPTTAQSRMIAALASISEPEPKLVAQI
ncbi:MAG: hypothetical protein RMM53_08065, partial [Bacteroidia bacterium]|nr:hypothetical protein [Bacteroidia bacterium]